jgi:hypothetical protein
MGAEEEVLHLEEALLAEEVLPEVGNLALKLKFVHSNELLFNEMKTLLSILIISCSFSLLAQKDSLRKPVKLKPGKVVRQTINPVKLADPLKVIFGDFIVDSFRIVGIKSPNKKELELLIGSLVRIQESTITGDEIDPMSFQVYEIEKMQSSDYLFREFGAESKIQLNDLPYFVKVHKTSHEECYGIVDMGGSGIAIPYKGALLFLRRK